MNEAVFIIALLQVRGFLTYREALALRKMAREETFSDDLSEMTRKVKNALKDANDASVPGIDEVDARDIVRLIENKS